MSDFQGVIGTDIAPADIPDVLGANDLDKTVSRRERLPRQRGCEEYEALPDLDKLNVSFFPDIPNLTI